MCGEKERHSTILGADDTSKHLSSLSDILRFLQERIDNTKTFNINVTREDLYQRGLKQWARQKQASPKNQLRICFIGEQGIDDGALRREFLTGKENQDGSPSNGCGAKQLSVQGFFQWVSGQAHVPLTDAERDSYRITVNFDHDCTSR
ncbi:hypothetical protein AMECASPLE_037377, partial [Ameca splendens]